MTEVKDINDPQREPGLPLPPLEGSMIPNTDEAAQEGARPFAEAGTVDEVHPDQRDAWEAIFTTKYDGAE